MKQMQKWGGAAALYEAFAYIVGFVGFIAIVNVGGISDAQARIAALGEQLGVLTALYLIVYVIWGASLVVLSLALHERLRGGSSGLTRVATAFGLIWALFVIASGMIYIVGMQAVVGLAAGNAEQAATVWLAVEVVFEGLGGGVEVVGGIWVVLLSVIGLREGLLSRAFSLFGLIGGAAGLLSVIPALSEITASIFGLTQIVWFIWLGIIMLRKPATVEDRVA